MAIMQNADEEKVVKVTIVRGMVGPKVGKLRPKLKAGDVLECLESEARLYCSTGRARPYEEGDEKKADKGGKDKADK